MDAGVWRSTNAPPEIEPDPVTGTPIMSRRKYWCYFPNLEGTKPGPVRSCSLWVEGGWALNPNPYPDGPARCEIQPTYWYDGPSPDWRPEPPYPTP